MSTIDLNQLIGMSPLDIVPAEAGTGNARPDPSGSFNDYLQRAQTSSADTGDNGTNNWGKDAGQPSAPRTEESRCEAASPAPQNDSEDDINGAESALKTNLPESEGRQPENEPQPVERGQTSSRTEKKEEDNKKDKYDGRDSLPAGKNQDNQPNLQIKPEVADAKSHSQLGEETSARQVELKETSNPLPVAPENVKTTADPGALTKAELLTANTSQTAGVEEGEAPVSTAMKGKASKKTALGNEKKAGISSVEKQADETISVSDEGGTSAAKISKDNPSSTRDLSRRSSHQNEKKQPSTARVAEAAASPAVSQEAPAVAAPVNSASLQAVVNAPFKLPKPAEDKIDARTTNITSNNKAADPINALPRLGQPASGTAATGTAASTSQRNGEETRSQLDGVRFVQRVERAFAAMGDRGGTVRLKLSPPELGSVRMEISVNKGVMKARLEAESKEAKNLLLENLPALRERLAQHDIKIQQFDVDLKNPSSGGTPQQTADQAETGSRDGGYRAPRPRTKENSGTPAITAGTARLADHSGQLNVII